MARAWPLIRALANDYTRAVRSYGSVSRNNLASLAILLAAANPPAASLILVLLGLPMLVASQQVSTSLQAERRDLLPLSGRERLLTRATGVLLQPLVWILMGLGVLGGRKAWPMILGLGAVGILSRAVFAWARAWRAARPGAMPRPGRPVLPGHYGPLLWTYCVMPLRTLDFQAAAILALVGTLYRFTTGTPTPVTLTATSILVVITFSTYAQTLFALEGPEGLARYRLLPLPGWKLLLLKDAAFLLALLPLLLPIAPIPGLAAALGALAAGHTASVGCLSRQPRWHFLRGVSYGHGLAQGTLMLSLGCLAHQYGAVALLPGLMLLAGSVAWNGRRLDRTTP